MAITIDWPNSIINIPKADTVLIQSVPTEIRELNLNVFRLTLKDLEDDADGMGFQKTHNHNTEVTVGGVTLARVVNILDPYTITFEDGQYAVNLVGSNSNVGDKVNVNQVSIRSANSAGMISSADIEFASYEGGVTVDITSSTTGTVHPAGTKRAPVNNLTDAMVIANYRGLSRIYIIGDLYIDNYGDYEGMEFIGESVTKSNVGVDSNANVLHCEFSNMTISGVLDGNSLIENSKILDLNYVTGTIQHSILGPGTITLAAGQSNILDCYGAVEGYTQNILNLGGSGKALSLNNFSGELSIINKTCLCPVDLQLNQGLMFLDETIVSGVIQARGIGTVVDNTADEVTVEIDDLLNKDLISTAVWETQLNDYVQDGTAAETLRSTAFDGNIWIDTISGVDATAFPAGTPYQPTDSIDNAVVISQETGITSFHIHGEVDLNGNNLDNCSFKGDAFHDIVNLGTASINYACFDSLRIAGAQTGEIHCRDCFIDNVSDICGFYTDCFFYGTITTCSGVNPTASLRSCTTVDPPVTIDFTGAGFIVGGSELSGNWVISGIDSLSPPDILSVSFLNGGLTLGESCTAGIVSITGCVNVTDNSGPGCLVTDNSTQVTFYESEPS